MTVRRQLSLRSERPAAMHQIPFAVLLALAVAACGALPAPTEIGPPEVPGPSVPAVATGAVRNGDLTLSAVAEPVEVAAGRVIHVTATLANEGVEDVEISGSGTGIVYFTVTRLEDGLTSGPPFMDGDCRSYPLSAGERTEVPFRKSGGYSPDDPNAAFMDAYYADPELTLPAGTWKIEVAAYGSIGANCSGDPLDLALELVVTVTD